MKTFYSDDKIEVGIDEAGCGSFIGPVVAAAVILPRKELEESEKKLFEKIRDSKKITSENVRHKLSDFIKDYALDYSISSVDHNEIDKINILQARFKVYKEVIDNLDITPDLILVDGNQFKPYINKNGDFTPFLCIEKGDNEYKSIAAASILAKVARDDYINKISTEFPEYNWDKNKGYGTKEHLEMIKKKGVTKYHRKTYGICKEL